jgi:hypothetical protein
MRGFGRWVAGFLALGACGPKEQPAVLPDTAVWGPPTSQFVDAAPMAEGRAGGISLVQLRDGAIMAIGGRSGTEIGDVMKSVEIYDPSFDVWETGPTLIKGRSGAAIVTLTDGRIFITGGDFPATGSTEILGLQSTSWSEGDVMALPRSWHVAVTMRDERVLVCGGVTTGDRPTDQCEIWDPEIGDFVPSAPLSAPRAYASAALLRDGRVLVTGGINARGAVGTSEIFTPWEDTWAPGPETASPRGPGHALITLDDGRLMLLGGSADTLSVSDVEILEEFGENTWRWAPVASMTAAREWLVAMPTGAGKVVAAGGRGFDGSVLDSAEIYDVAANTWAPLEPLSSPRRWGAGMAVGDGSVVMVGGYPE